MKQTKTVKLIFTDLIWYFFGAAVPGIISIVKNPIFTRYFTTEEYGLYNIAFISFDYLSIVLYSWIVSSIWRYYLNYKKNNKKASFYSSVTFLFIVSTFILLLTSVIIQLFNNNIELRNLYMLAAVQTITGTVLNVVFILYRIEGKSKQYNILNALRAVLNFSVLYIITFRLGLRTEAMFYNLIIIDFAFILFVFATNSHIFGKISYKLIDFSTIKTFLHYGFSTFIVNICLVILISSDRYILVYFRDMSEVGLYSVIYNLSYVSINMLVAVFLNAVRPHLFDFLENKKEKYPQIAGFYLSIFLILFLPTVSLLSVHSKEIAYLLLSEDFRIGYPMLPFIFFSTFLYGIAMYSEIKLKFDNKLNYLIFTFLTAAILNLILNFIFIPLWGYMGAAMTTLLAYLLLFILLAVKTKTIFYNLHLIKILPFISITILYILLLYIFPESNLTQLFFRLLLFGVIYISLLYRFYKLEIKTQLIVN